MIAEKDFFKNSFTPFWINFLSYDFKIIPMTVGIMKDDLNNSY